MDWGRISMEAGTQFKAHCNSLREEKMVDWTKVIVVEMK